jgi:hypothetical protein
VPQLFTWGTGGQEEASATLSDAAWNVIAKPKHGRSSPAGDTLTTSTHLSFRAAIATKRGHANCSAERRQIGEGDELAELIGLVGVQDDPGLGHDRVPFCWYAGTLAWPCGRRGARG